MSAGEPDELDLARTMDAALAAALTIPQLLAAAADDTPPGQATQRSLRALGWSGIAVPESSGGLDLPWHLAARLAAVAGRRLLPASMRGETFVLAPALAALTAAGHGDAAELLALLLDGELYGGAAVFDAGADSTVAYLPPGAQLVALVHPDRVSVRRIAELDSVSALQGLDPGQGASLVRDDGGPPGDLELDGRAAADLRRRWAVAGMCEAFGAAQRCLEMACEYASEREQFGVKIVSFQAVSHRLARMAVGLEAAEAGIGRLVAPQGDDGRLLTALSHAVPAAARCACEGAIQVFGGAGFSWELGLHLYYRRVLAIQHELGGDGASLRRAGAGYLASIRERDDG